MLRAASECLEKASFLLQVPYACCIRTETYQGTLVKENDQLWVAVMQYNPNVYYFPITACAKCIVFLLYHSYLPTISIHSLISIYNLMLWNVDETSYFLFSLTL